MNSAKAASDWSVAYWLISWASSVMVFHNVMPAAGKIAQEKPQISRKARHDAAPGFSYCLPFEDKRRLVPIAPELPRFRLLTLNTQLSVNHRFTRINSTLAKSRRMQVVFAGCSGKKCAHKTKLRRESVPP